MDSVTANFICSMQPVEKVNKVFLAKLLVLFGLLYLGFLFKVPHFLKAKNTDSLQHYASPEIKESNSKQIQQLYYRLVSDSEPEEFAI